MKKDNKIKIKTLSICTLFLLSSFILFGYSQYHEYRYLTQKYRDECISIIKEEDIFLKSILLENQRKAELNIEFHTNMIHNKLLESYNNNLDALEKDIINPEENTKLVKIIDKLLTGVYVNNNDICNKPFVASLSNVIWNRVLPYNYKDNTSVVSWNDFINKHYNIELSKKARDALVNMNTDKNEFIFWEALNNTNPKHKKIDNMDIKEVLSIYHNEGLDSLKSYELLIPVYITKSGDIFGTRDADNKGHKLENYKIISIQRVNIYDALVQYSSEINYFENRIDNIKSESKIMMNRKAFNMTVSAILSIITLVGSAYLQNKRYE